MCVLGENEFICNDSLFKVLPQTAIQQGGSSFTEREGERGRETSVLIKNTDGGKEQRWRMKKGEDE